MDHMIKSQDPPYPLGPTPGTRMPLPDYPQPLAQANSIYGPNYSLAPPSYQEQIPTSPNNGVHITHPQVVTVYGPRHYNSRYPNVMHTTVDSSPMDPSSQVFVTRPQPIGYQSHPTVVIAPMGQMGVVPCFGEWPVLITCKHCGNTGNTVTRSQPNVLTWIICATLCVLLMWPCCLYPFCLPGMKDVYHYCPHCTKLIGINKKC